MRGVLRMSSDRDLQNCTARTKGLSDLHVPHLSDKNKRHYVKKFGV